MEFHLQQLRSEVDRRRDWLNGLAGQARQLAKELNYPVSSGRIAEQMDILREAISEHRDRLQARKQITQGMKRIRQKQLRLRDQGRRLSDQRRKLEDDARLRREQSRLEKRVKADRIKALKKQRDELQQELNEIRERHALTEESRLLEMADDELNARLESQSARRARIQDRLLKQSEKRGRLRALLSLDQEESTANGKPLPAWEQLVEKAQQVSQACEVALRNGHATATTANGHRYFYLELAAGYLQLLSAGQFVHIAIQDDESVALTDHHGQVSRLEDLRREHYANIYYSMWLARLDCFAARGLRLPIVMEDPLEATDGPRRSIVAQLLIDFAAKGHQVILVTADPINADLFAHLDVPIADVAQRQPLPVPPPLAAPEIPPTAEFARPQRGLVDGPVVDSETADEPLFPPLG